MAMAISHSAAASLTSGFFYSVFRFLSLTRSNRADHPRWYVGDRDYSRLRCGVAETQPRPSARISAAMLVRFLSHFASAAHSSLTSTSHLKQEPRCDLRHLSRHGLIN